LEMWRSCARSLSFRPLLVRFRSSSLSSKSVIRRFFSAEKQPVEATVVKELPPGQNGRLLQPFLFATFVAGGSIYLAEEMIRAKNEAAHRDLRARLNRMFDHPFFAQDSILSTFMGCNLLVYFMWKFRRLKPWMMEHFAFSVYNKRLAPMVLSAFSHSRLVFLFGSLYVLATLIPRVVWETGTERFWALYIGSSVFSALGGQLNQLLAQSHIPKYGASGAICGVFAAYCYMFPEKEIALPGIDFPPLNYADFTLFTLFMAVSFTWALFPSNLYHNLGAPLGGVAFGAGYAYWLHKTGRVQRYERKASK